MVWLTAATGLVLPWATAAAVKLYLQGQGTPTWPWSTFVVYAPLGVPLSAICAAPFLVLAFLARAWALGHVRPLAGASPVQRRLVVLLTLAGGAVGMARAFVRVFWVFDPEVLLYLPLIILAYLPWMGGGLAIGIAAALVAGALQGTARPQHP